MATARSLQEAADDLVRRVLAIGRAFRISGFSVSPEFPYDRAALSLVSELDEVAAAGGDVCTQRHDRLGGVIHEYYRGAA